MKKISSLTILIIPLFLAWCWNTKNDISNTQKLDNNKPLINVEEKTKESEKILKKIWLTWNKLKDELARQKAWWEIIASIKWDERKKYILETEILPQIIKSWKVSSKCTTTNLNNYLSCLYVTHTPIEKLLKELPPETRNLVKKRYYKQVYSLDRKKLLQPTNDPIAIQMKKETIKQLFFDWVIRNISACNKLAEKELQTYCKNLFKQK